MPPIDDAEGVKNLDAALSGDTALHGATKEQITALGGEFDDDLDGFTSDPAARGDTLDEPKVDDDEEPKAEEEPKADEEADEEAEEEPKADEEAEEEPKADEEAEEEPKADDDEGKPKDTKPPVTEQRIPKSRFDEVNARRKAAEDELAQLKAQAKAAEDAKTSKFDFDAAEEAYMELLLAGKTKDALAKRKEINSAQEQVWAENTAKRAVNNVAAERVQEELDEAVAKYEQMYDRFNPESEEYSEDLVSEVETFFAGYLEKRKDLSPQQAFELAVDTTARLYGLKPNGTSEPSEEPKPEPVVKKGVKKDIKGKVALQKAAPKDTSKSGDAGDSSGAHKLDVLNMTDEELDALPESTRKRLRGDEL